MDDIEIVQTPELVPVTEDGRPALPPVLLGRATPEVAAQVGQFYDAVAAIFERWVTRRASKHTQRAYRQDVMAFAEFMGLGWPDEATRLLAVTVADVLAFRDELVADDKAPKTINRRIASLSSFYKYLQGAASELRLPITVPNPAHAQFIGRGAADPRDERRALSATRARQLMGLPAGDTLLDYRDRAILKFFLYTGARLGTGCRLKVGDFHQEGDEATIALHEKGDRRRKIGLHFAAAQAIAEYIEKAGLTRGPFFRARRHWRRPELSEADLAGDDVHAAGGVPGAAARRGARGGGDRGGRQHDEGEAVPLHAALDPGDDGDAAARRRGGHHQGEGAARAPARDDDADLRQAADGAPRKGPRTTCPSEPPCSAPSRRGARKRDGAHSSSAASSRASSICRRSRCNSAASSASVGR
jgi:site-specific recombinase XerD